MKLAVMKHCFAKIDDMKNSFEINLSTENVHDENRTNQTMKTGIHLIAEKYDMKPR